MKRNTLRGVRRVTKVQQQLQHGSVNINKRQRFRSCPVCNRSFAIFLLEDHANKCLDSSHSPFPSGTPEVDPKPSCESSDAIPSVALSFADAPPCSPLFHKKYAASFEAVDSCVTALSPASIGQSAAITEPRLLQSPISSPIRSFIPTKIRSTEVNETSFVSSCYRLTPTAVCQAWVDKTVHGSTPQGPLSASRQDEICSANKCLSLEVCRSESLVEVSADERREFCSEEAEKAEVGCASGFSGFSCMDGVKTNLADHPPFPFTGSDLGETPRAGTFKDIFFAEKKIVDEARNEDGEILEKPPPGFKIFQRQVQSQARLSMCRRFSCSVSLQRKPAVTVLQPGMVLFRSWLDLETQEKLIRESQSVAHLFHRPTTSGGGKYHVYSMCWGPKWDTKAHRYVSGGPEQPLPVWMFELSQKLAWDAQQHTSVYPSNSIFVPDVGLVNFYPVKANELGVIGLGGHQDLDDSSLMPVVSVSLGDSMTFFYRRLPPISRRKSGISVSVDEKAAKCCQDGDVAHNMEHRILLESGDVLVFGGQSRLVYHGTRHVQPGTRPPGLHMVPGRLNFTFRQTKSKTV